MKGIWIPVELMEIDISWTKRILLAEISQLEMLDKGCIATNSHFAEKLKLTTQAVSKALNELNKEEFIAIDNAQTKRNFGRKITINFGKITINFGKSGINFGKSGIHESGESKENSTINKPINKPNNTYTQDEIKENPNLNSESVIEWLEFKKYKSKASITKCINFLSKYDKDTQKEIVDTSIMNGWKGLFPPKQKNIQPTQNKTRETIDKVLAGMNRNEECDYEQ